MTRGIKGKYFADKRVFVIGLFIIFGLVLLLFSGGVERIEGAAKYYPISSTSTEHWAWNDVIGWIDFNFFPSDPLKTWVSSEELRGAASSSLGPVYLNCSDFPDGCGYSFGVENLDHIGTLAYDAWNDIFGRLRFYTSSSLSNYSVLITSRITETPPSDFSGWAWNPLIGWVSFNCIDLNYLDPSNDFCHNAVDYKVTTDWYASSTSGWIESATFDTGSEGGAQFNSISWRGSTPVGTRVAFYFAVSSSTSGPWDYKGPYYPAPDPNNDLLSAPFGYGLFDNARYFRYKVVLFSNSIQTLSPTVEEVFVNWSP